LEWIVYAGLIAVCYGAIDEFLQTFIPLRKGSFYDWMIDSAGAVVTLLIITKIFFIKMRKGDVKKAF
jgi:VanZ family protein